MPHMRRLSPVEDRRLACPFSLGNEGTGEGAYPPLDYEERGPE
jgi:hypothetical protein